MDTQVEYVFELDVTRTTRESGYTGGKDVLVKSFFSLSALQGWVAMWAGSGWFLSIISNTYGTMSEVTITKSMVELYKIRFAKGGLWADITIDEYEKSGRISIASDFGSWEHFWGSCGEGFKKFLCGLDIHYAAGKFGEGRWFDHDATMAELKKAVEEHDDAEEKEAMVEELESLEDCTEVNSFCHLAYSADTLHKLWDTGPNIHTDVSPMFRRFWLEIWPHFTDELRKEAQNTL